MKTDEQDRELPVYARPTNDELQELHRYSGAYAEPPGLRTIFRGVEQMVDHYDAPDDPPLAAMGYKEAEALYDVIVALDWFVNFGEGYARRLEPLREVVAARIDVDPDE